MAMTMCTDVNSVEIKAAAVWIDGNSHNKGHETIKPQEASLFLGVPFTYSVTSEGAGLQSKTFGYKIQSAVTVPWPSSGIVSFIPIIPKTASFRNGNWRF